MVFFYIVFCTSTHIQSKEEMLLMLLNVFFMHVSVVFVLHVVVWV